mgnify:CR=1 FL=1
MRQLQIEVSRLITAAIERAGNGGNDRRILAVKFGGEDALFDVEEMAILLKKYLPED